MTPRPRDVERTIRRVDTTFDRPHAVIVIARGGPWEGVPIFHAWVTPESGTAQLSSNRGIGGR